MKRIILFAATAALFAACASDDLGVKEQPQVQAEPNAVVFDAYTQRATTRGGVPGTLTTNTSGTVMLTEKGFGVFAYYTDNNDYDQRSVPNFMFNQKVTYEAGNWKYEPVVYWPNEYGDDAKSDDTDRVTFFAYAPWVDVVPTTGKLRETSNGQEQWGIISMNRNNAQGDPMIKYIASFDNGKSVDLAWGVCSDPNWSIVEGHGTLPLNNGVAGKPWIDVKRPALGTSSEYQKVKFNFKHALAQMQVKIDADIDVKGHSEGDNYASDGKTRVWVREITFKGFVMKGTLNLNNDTQDKPYWMDYNGQNDIVAEDVVVYDQRKEGKEGVAGAIATNEKVGGLNPILIQDEPYKVASGSVYTKGQKLTNKTGVPTTPVNLFAAYQYNEDGTVKTSGSDPLEATDGFFHVIPVDGEDFYIEIVYDIETVDENLAQNLSDGVTKGSTIENRIRQEVFHFNGTETCLLPGHSYKINIHLGLNSVKFDAEVTPWIEEPTQEVELPSNAPQYKANTTDSGTGSAEDAAYAVTIPYFGEYIFALTGLNGGETMKQVAGKMTTNLDGGTLSEKTGVLNGYDVSTSSEQSWTATENPANGNGVAIQTLNAKPNPTTIDQIQKWTWKGNQNGKTTYFTFTQQAHPLFFQITGFADATSGDDKKSTITIQRYNNALHIATTGQTDWTNKYGWLCDGDGKKLDEALSFSDANYIKVWRNGTALTWNKTLANVKNNDNFFMPNMGDDDKVTNTITIGDQLQPGDVIQIEIKTGDAPAETVTATVGGIFYAPATRTVTYRESPFKYDLTPTHVGEGDLAATLTGDPSASVSISGFNVTTLKAGNVTITATSDNPFDAVKTATFTLTVKKQDSYIKDETMADEPILAGIVKTAGTPVKDLSGKKSNGVEDSESDAGAITVSLFSATDNGSPITASDYFDVDANVLKVKNELTAGHTYTVTVEGTAAEVTDKYNSCTKRVTYTFEAKDS